MLMSRRLSTFSIRSGLVGSMGRFRKKQVSGDGKTIGGGKKGEDEKSKAEKAYGAALMKAYKYTKPKDKRTPEQKAAWIEESVKWGRLMMEEEKIFVTHEQKRLDFMWEAINIIPAGKLRDAAMTEDPTPPPDVMCSLVLTDIGPIPESEVERLDPLVIDHTVLQKMNEQASNMEEDMKTAAQKDVKDKANASAGKKEAKAAGEKKEDAPKKEEKKPAEKKPEAKKEEKKPAEKKPAKKKD